MKFSRKCIVILLCILFLLNYIPAHAASNKSPKLILNNKELILEGTLVIEKDIVLVPYKKLSEKLNLWVDTIDAGKYKTINIFSGQKNLYMIVNSPLVSVIKLSDRTKDFYSQYFKMSKAPKIINGKVYLPLKFICDLFGFSYKFDKNKNAIYISGKVSSKITETEAIKKWCKKEEITSLLNKYTDELIESSKNILNYTIAYESIGKDLWLNKPEIIKYSYVLSDLDGNILKVKNLSRYRITDIILNKATGDKSPYYNSKVDKIATNYVLVSGSKKYVLTISDNDYKVDALPAYLEDIHKKYNWTKEVWTSIENSEVINGMNPSQVIIAVGKPDDTKSVAEVDNRYDGWYYSDKEIYFENGKVVDVKHLD